MKGFSHFTSKNRKLPDEDSHTMKRANTEPESSTRKKKDNTPSGKDRKIISQSQMLPDHHITQCRNRSITVLFHSMNSVVKQALKESQLAKKVTEKKQEKNKPTHDNTVFTSNYVTPTPQEPLPEDPSPAQLPLLNISPHKSRSNSKFKSEFLQSSLPIRPRQVNIGGYTLELDRVLGKGSYGTVYLGQRHFQSFAIKRILKARLADRSRVERLIQKEKDILRKINHPNVLRIHEFLETKSSFFIITQFYPDGDLGTLLKKEGALPESKALFFLFQIMLGFQELRAHQVMHRDFKPDNVFLDGGRAVIGDFGFAKAGVEVATTVLGTPYFIAPEVLGEGGPVAIYSSKVDLWSIGVSFYQMLFGSLPWDTSSTGGRITRDLLVSSSGERLTFPPGKTCSPGSLNLLKRLLDPDPATRIDWEVFFSHPVFTQVPLCKPSIPERVTSFQLRRKTQIEKDSPKSELSLLTPEGSVTRSNLCQVLDPEEEHRKNCSKRAQSEAEKARVMLVMRKCIDRLRFEIHLFQFVSNTGLDLLDLSAVQNLPAKLSHLFSLVGVLLLKLAVMLNTRALLSLQRGDNLFDLEGFQFFQNTEYSSKMSSYLEKYLRNNVGLVAQSLERQLGHHQLREEVVALCKEQRPSVERHKWLMSELTRETDQEVSRLEEPGQTEQLIPQRLLKGVKSMFAQLLLCKNYKNEFEYSYEVANNRWQNIENKLQTEEYTKITIECYRMEQSSGE